VPGSKEEGRKEGRNEEEGADAEGVSRYNLPRLLFILTAFRRGYLQLPHTAYVLRCLQHGWLCAVNVLWRDVWRRRRVRQLTLSCNLHDFSYMTNDRISTLLISSFSHRAWRCWPAATAAQRGSVQAITRDTCLSLFCFVFLSWLPW